MSQEKKIASKKIAIISINRYSQHLNYGAALHSYAFQQVLNKLGYENKIVDYMPNFLKWYNIKYPLGNMSRSLSFKGKIIWLLRWTYGFFSNIQKYNKFESFFKNKCEFTIEKYDTQTIDNVSEHLFDTYICESDVIWKLTSTHGVDKGYFLNFQSAINNKRIAYSPSIGRKDMENSSEEYLKYLKEFDYISTREVQSAQYLSKLLNRDIDCVLDPTLLLDKIDYLKLAIAPKERKYVLVYNCMINDKEMIMQATRFAKEKKMQLIEISSFHENKLLRNHTVKDNLGIEEFLGYFDNAAYIICNGFHGACFSLIFNKEFTLFQRDKSDYRMTSLIDIFELRANYVKVEYKSNNLSLFQDSIDYKFVNKKLAMMKHKSFEYLINSLSHE